MSKKQAQSNTSQCFLRLISDNMALHTAVFKIGYFLHICKMLNIQKHF